MPMLLLFMSLIAFVAVDIAFIEKQKEEVSLFQVECAKLGGITVEAAKPTGAYDLKCLKVEEL